MQEKLQAWFKQLKSRVDDLKALRVLREAFKGYGEAEASQGAAGLAYYMLFSLFPLMLLLVT